MVNISKVTGSSDPILMCDIVHYITLAFHKYELNNSYTFRDIKHLRKINKILKNWQKSEKNREKWKNQMVFLDGEKKNLSTI